MAAKEKINLLEVIPCRSEHITAEREGETIVLSFPRLNIRGCNASLYRQECRRTSCAIGRTRYGCMGTDRWKTYCS